jgi:hypothetical protein
MTFGSRQLRDWRKTFFGVGRSKFKVARISNPAAAAPLFKSEAEAGALITSVITRLLIRRIMSIIDTIKDATPIQLVVYSILAIPIGWHIYITYKEQRRRVEKPPPWRKDWEAVPAQDLLSSYLPDIFNIVVILGIQSIDRRESPGGGIQSPEMCTRLSEETGVVGGSRMDKCTIESGNSIWHMGMVKLQCKIISISISWP